MASETEGYYVAHPTSIDRLQYALTCGYYQVAHRDGAWQQRHLFNFTIPTHLLMGGAGERLYESFLPLVPRVADNAVYYVDGGEQGKLRIYKYDLISDTKSALGQGAQTADMLFAPLKVQAMVFYGGSLLSEDLGTGNTLPAMWINQEGYLCADLPQVVDMPERTLALLGSCDVGVV
jgi:hypothetical protein